MNNSISQLEKEIAAFDISDPWSALTEKQQCNLINWCHLNMAPRRSYDWKHNSYGYKHEAQRDLGHYVSNAQMKTAMILAGFEPSSRRELNPSYCTYLRKKYRC